MPVNELTHAADDKMAAGREEKSYFLSGFRSEDHRHLFGRQIVTSDWHKKCIFNPVPFFDLRSFTCAFISDL